MPKPFCEFPALLPAHLGNGLRERSVADAACFGDPFESPRNGKPDNLVYESTEHLIELREPRAARVFAIMLNGANQLGQDAGHAGDDAITNALAQGLHQHSVISNHPAGGNLPIRQKSQCRC